MRLRDMQTALRALQSAPRSDRDLDLMLANIIAGGGTYTPTSGYKQWDGEVRRWCALPRYTDHIQDALRAIAKAGLFFELRHRPLGYVAQVNNGRHGKADYLQCEASHTREPCLALMCALIAHMIVREERAAA